MRALITGGAGFIGSHLADYLLAQGDEVYIIDDLSTGTVRNIAHLKQHPKFHYTVDSISNEAKLAELIDECDVVYHLAAVVGVFLVVEQPVYTIENILKGTELVLKWASKKKKKVLVTSTSEVYGKGVKIPFSETDDLLIGPSYMGRWSYACAKLMDEFLSLAYYRERNQPVVVARLFNTVGPRQSGRYGMVIPRFAEQALTGAPLSVYGNGQQSRCFNHVRDTVDALYGLMNSDKTVGKIYNVGNPQEVTIEDLAKKVIALTESPSQIEYIPYSTAYTEGFEDMQRRVPDLTRIKGAIDYAPTATLDDIIREVVAYLQSDK